MKELPAGARRLLYIVYVLGAATLAFTYGTTHPGMVSGALLGESLLSPMADRGEIALFLLLGMLSGSKKVVLLRLKQKEDVGSMSLGFAVIFAALIRFGAPVAVLVGLFSTLSSCVYPKRFPLHQTLFNLSVNAIQTACAGAVMYYLNGRTLHIVGIETIPAIIASALTFFVVNTGFVAAIIALASGKGLREIGTVWQETFFWTAPSYFLGAGVSSLAVMMLGRNIAFTLLCGSVVAYFTHASYRRYMERADALVESKDRLADLYLATIRSLALAIDAKDQYTHQHILRVQQYAVAIAKQMGMRGEELTAIETSALLHDIGKLGVPEYVLLKPGRLTDEEFAKIKEHPRIGADILDPVPFPWPVLPGVKHHHEKWDGTGYPDGLKGEEIPLQGRILAVADVYDALTSNRSYRNAWTHEKAVAEIRDKAGSHFDPVVVEAFLAVIDGVVDQMAEQGIGPKAAPLVGTPAPGVPARTTRADEAARDIQRAASELWALYEVAQTLSSSLGLQETLDILARKLAAILPDTGCLFLLRAGAGSVGPARFADGTSTDAMDALEVRVAVGVNQVYFANGRTNGPDSLSMRVARECTTYLGAFDVEDLFLITPTGQTNASVPWNPFQTALIVPIVHQGEVLGTINLYHALPGAFSQHDRQLLEMVAERAAMAIYNGLLFDRTLTNAMTDPLTGLANIRFLTEHVEKRCAEQRPFSLLCLDLDSFKPINDNFGHQKGDRVLRDLGALFRRTVRPEDVVVRYGGDEFLILVEDTEYLEALAIEARLQEAVSEYDTGLQHARIGSVRLGVSIGIASFPRDGDDVATLISVADGRMYQDKAERKLMRMINSGTAPQPRDIPSGCRTARTRAKDLSLPPTSTLTEFAPDYPEEHEETRLAFLSGASEEIICLK